MKLTFWTHTQAEPDQQAPKGHAPEAGQPESNTDDRLATDHQAAPLGEALSRIAALESIDELLAAPAARKVAVADSQPVTERVDDKRSEDRSLYQELLGGLYDAVVIVDPQGTVIGSNPRTGKLFGYDADDLWNERCEALIPVMKQTVLAKIRSHAESGRFTIVNASCARKDGSTFPAEIAINRINLFNEGDLLFSVRSIERRVCAQDKKSVDVMVMDNAGAAIVVCSADGQIEHANPAFLQLVGAATEKDVVRRFAGEFCTSHEAGMQLLLKHPAGASRWVGRLQLVTDRKHNIDVMATAARTEVKQKARVQIVLTFTPIPRMAAVAQPVNRTS